jgi:hypothetical protein
MIGLEVPCKCFMMALIASLFPTHKLETVLIIIRMWLANEFYIQYMDASRSSATAYKCLGCVSKLHCSLPSVVAI